MGDSTIRRTEGRFNGADGAPLFRRSWTAGPAGRTMVIVHGFGEHSGRYDEMACWFASRGFAVHAYDHRGHGQSSGKRGHADSVDALLDDLEVLLALAAEESEPGAQRILVGHSMGGLVVSALAALREPDIDLLVTSSALLQLGPDISPIKLRMAKLMRRIAPRLSMSAGLDHQGLSTDPEVIRRYEEDPLVHGQLTAALGGSMMEAVPAVHAAAGRVSVPVLVLHGEDDPLCPPEGSRAFFAALPEPGVTGSALRTYPGLRHEIFNEPSREQVFGDVLDFLERHAEKRGVGSGPGARAGGAAERSERV